MVAPRPSRRVVYAADPDAMSGARLVVRETRLAEPPTASGAEITWLHDLVRAQRPQRLPAAVKAKLAAHIERGCDQRQADPSRGAGWVRAVLARGTATTRTNPPSTRPCKEAARRAGVAKPATCHTFQHSFTTLLEDADAVRSPADRMSLSRWQAGGAGRGRGWPRTGRGRAGDTLQRLAG